MSTYGAITVDGNLSDWQPADRIDLGPGAVPGYTVYGKVVGNALVIALTTDGTVIGNGTTFWLDTDLNDATGYKVFGFAGGAEYNVHMSGGLLRLYTGAAGQFLVSSATLDYVIAGGGTRMEIAIPLSNFVGTVTAADLLFDINEQDFLPSDYALRPYELRADPAPVTVGDITLDGSLADWTASDRIDEGNIPANYQMYGKATGDAFVFAIKSNVAFTSGSTIWLNTDENASTGYQIFGWAGGAEYNINFDAYGNAALYSGAAGQTLIADNLVVRYSPDMKTVEVAIAKADIGSPLKLGVIADVNDSVHLPADYSGPQYQVLDGNQMPARVDLSKKVAIVYSETTANAYFEKTAYSQLFMAAQNQAGMAGIPFDILTEADLKDINILKEYDAIVFPSFSHVKAADYADIVEALELAVSHYHIGLITAGDFMTNNESGGTISGDPYSVMRDLLDIQRIDGGFPANVTVRAGANTHDITNDYTTNEVVRSYTGVGWSAFDDVSGNGTTLFTQTVGATTYNAAIATETGGRNVHFSTDAVMADNNLLWQSIDWAVNGGEEVSVGLQMSRQTSIVSSRNDMDQAQEAQDVDPPANGQGIYDKLVPILQEWKDLYNFVGSYYIDIGNYGPEQQTNWAVSSVYYQQMLAMGNEIGSHSYTHPHDTNFLFADVVTQAAFDAAVAHYQAALGTSDIVYSPYALRDDANPAVLSELAGLSLTQLNQRLAAALAAPNPATLSEADKAILESSYTFQFARSKALIEQQLGITVDGAAVPGAPEKLAASLAMLGFYGYLSGGYSGVGAGYPGAFGYITPDMQDHVYLAPNMSFDFTLVEWQNKTPAQALAAWIAEFTALSAHADVPVIMWPWHDYGPTEWMLDEGEASGYTKQMFADFIAAAYNAGAEFVTAADLAKRIASFEKSAVTFSKAGNVITATVTSTDAGKFALDLDHLGAQQIVSVSGWYAYDSDSVFLPRNGGTYAISLGTTPVDVTHIITLPSRAELVSLTGDGRSLNFTIVGEGNIVIDLKNPAGRALDVQGATIVSQAGDLLTLKLATVGSHNVTVTLNATPSITSDGGGAAALLSVVENTTAVTTVVASDIDAPEQAITYSIVGGADAALFTINASTGVLAFINAPNFEAPNDLGANNTYDVIVRASDGIVHDEQSIEVTVTNANEAPEITSNGGGGSASVSVAENGTAVTSVAASDPDVGATITYSIVGGADAALFAIDANTGALAFLAAPNFEAPGDAGANNVYDVAVRASDGSLHDEQAIAVTVTDANDAPVISSDGGGASANVSVAENGTAVTTVVAADADAGATITYSIAGGADAALLAIDANTGALTFVAPPNFEAPGDAGADNVYVVIVRASDGALFDEQTLAVTITDVNEAPVITSNGGDVTAAASVGENTTSVTSVAATDPDAGAVITYSIVGGADSALFTIDANTGALAFLAAPNFETPADANADNIYDVIVRASDGTLFDEQTIAVTVTDANEAPVISSDGGDATAAINSAENGTAITTVTASDPDAGTTITYSISGGADAALFAIDADTGVLTFIAPPNFEAPGDAGADGVYDVAVRASDGTLFDEQALAITVTDAADAPVIGSDGGGATASASIGENTSAATTVAATDQDAGAVITYSITGGADAALFAIDVNTGALTFIAPPNFEAPGDVGADNVFDVVVRASDGALFDEQALAVTVTDANEAPVVTSDGGDATGAVSVGENGVAVTTVVAGDVDAGATLTYSISGGADAALFAIDANTGALTFIAPPNFEVPADAGADNVYDVVVRASDGTLFDEQALAVTVTDANEAPEISSDGGGATGAVSIAENGAAVTSVVAADVDAGAVITYSISGGADAALFSIDANTGALSFIAPPNFEAPADAGADNVYDVVVRASDGALFDEQALAITVTDANEAPVISSNGGDATAAVSLVENLIAVTTVAATDVDAGAAITYSIVGGADAALFTIDANTSALAFLAAPDFELPGDAGADNIYDVVVRASDGTLFDEQALAVTITNDLDATPVITSNGGGATGAVTMAENIGAATIVIATDADNQALTYSIVGGADAARFAIDSVTGALTFVTAPDFELPADADGNNVYDVIVRASDGGRFDEQTLSFTITDDFEQHLVGTAAADILTGAALADRIDGAAGDDQLFGEESDDLLIGGDGNDTLDGGAGADTMQGGLGDDVYLVDGADHAPVENANEGADTVRTTNASYTLGANIENLVGIAPAGQASGSTVGQTLIGNGANNIITGGSGDDIVRGLGGGDALNGGAGFDYASYDGAASGVAADLKLGVGTLGDAAGDTFNSIEGLLGSGFNDSLLGNTGANRFFGFGGADFLFGGDGDDVLVGGEGDDSLGGWDGFDWLEGGAGIDWLSGGLGDDRLDGGAGNDTLEGQGGIDTMIGGAGDDVYHVDDFYDDVRELGGEGVDTVYASVNWGIRANVENLFLVGTAAINAYGDNANNVLVGNDAANSMGGFGGADWMEGNGGNDWLSGGDGDDRLDGGVGNDTIEGQAGVDLMIGGAGDDVYFVEHVADEVRENTGEGSDFVFSSVSWNMANNVETLILSGSSAINGYGNSQANTIAGNDAANVITGGGGADWLEGKGGNDWLEGGSANDRLDGGAGADRVDGGAGADLLFGGGGADTFYYGAASDSSAASFDSIQDFEVGVDKLNLAAVRTGAQDVFTKVGAYGNTYVFVDLGGDGSTDMLIELVGVTNLSNTDIIWSS